MEIVSYITKSSANLAPDAVFYKLEKLGFDVGQRLVERRAKDRRRFQDHLEIIKFVCTELWTDAYGKPIDNLRTNHKVSRFFPPSNLYRATTLLTYTSLSRAYLCS